MLGVLGCMSEMSPVPEADPSVFPREAVPFQGSGAEAFPLLPQAAFPGEALRPASLPAPLPEAGWALGRGCQGTDGAAQPSGGSAFGGLGLPWPQGSLSGSAFRLQDDKDLVPEFVNSEGLTCLVSVGAEADQNYQNYILRGESD